MSKEVDEIVALFTQFRSRSWVPETRLQGWEQQEFDLAIAEFRESLNDNNMVPINVYPAHSRHLHERAVVPALYAPNYSSSALPLGSTAQSGSSEAKHSMSRWSPEENRRLEALRRTHPEAAWAEIAGLLKTKTAKQCCQQWHRVIRVEKKGRWSAEEDNTLLAQISVNAEPSISGRSRLQISNRLKILLRGENQ